MKKSVLTAFGIALVAPVVALAQQNPTWPSSTTTGTPDPGYVNSWIQTATSWLSQALTIIMVLMTLWFLIGVFRYIMEKDASKLAEKRKVMLNGMIGLFVAVSVWGIIKIAGGVFGTNNATATSIQCPPGTTLSQTGRCEIPNP